MQLNGFLPNVHLTCACTNIAMTQPPSCPLPFILEVSQYFLFYLHRQCMMVSEFYINGMIQYMLLSTWVHFLNILFCGNFPIDARA